MDDLDLDLFKALLLAKRDEILNAAEVNRQSSQTVELDQSRVGRLSRMDALQGQAMSLEAQRRNEIALHRISSALLRLDGGNYGICIRCDEDIAIKRLEVDPAAPLCIRCAEQSTSD